MRCVRVEFGGALLVDGPAVVKSISGRIEVFGAVITSVEIPPFKRYPLCCHSNSCVVEVLGGQVVEVEKCTIPSDWNIDASGITLIVGPTDSGKSSIATYLLNRAVTRGMMVCVVDGDVGQSDIGPPGVIGVSCTSAPTPHTSLLPMEDGEFVGSVNLSGVEDVYVAALVSAVKKALAKYPHVVILNTGGWVTGRGRQLLRSIMLALKPSLVIDTGVGIRGAVRVSQAPAARVRTREERGILRSLAYSRHLGQQFEHRVSWNVVDGWIADCEVAQDEIRCGEKRVVPDPSADRAKTEDGTVRVPLNALRSIYSGLYRGERLVGVGLLDAFSATLRTSVSEFDRVVVGRMAIVDGREITLPV